MTATTTTPGRGGWSVVLPVKGGGAAKTRLAHPARAGLARALGLDAVTAVLACDEVARTLVVTGDAETSREHAALGALVQPDPGRGLDAALRAGAAAADPDAPCALLLADLPSLRPADLAATLRACTAALLAGARQVTVPDADGSGTVLLAAGRPDDLRPQFGPGSAAAHARTAQVLHDAPARLRRDVDTGAHLQDALSLGVGRWTREALAGRS